MSSIINTLLKNNVIQTLKSEFLICSYECPIVLFIHPFRKYMSTCLANNSGRPQNRMMLILENSMSTLRQTGPLCRTTQISLRTRRETESQNSKGHFLKKYFSKNGIVLVLGERERCFIIFICICVHVYAGTYTCTHRGNTSVLMSSPTISPF